MIWRAAIVIVLATRNESVFERSFEDNQGVNLAHKW